MSQLSAQSPVALREKHRRFAKVAMDALQSVKLPTLAFLFLLAVCLPAGFSLGPLSMNPVRLYLLIVTPTLLVNLLRGEYGKILFSDIMLLSHILWVIASLAVNDPGRVVQFAGSTSIELLGGYLVARATIRDRATFIRLVNALCMIIIMLFPFVIIETLTAKPLLIHLINMVPGLNGYNTGFIGTRMGLNRVRAVFLHPIHFGLFASVLFCLCYIGMKDVYSNGKRILVSSIIAVSGFLSLSSGAVMSFMLQFMLIFWAIGFDKVKSRWIILTSLVVLAYVVVDIISTRPPIRVFLHYLTFSAHTAYWRTLIFEFGMQNVWENPIFGLGLGDWKRPFWMHSGSMDNFWLVQAVRYGIPGFVLIALPYIWLLWKVGRRSFDSDPLLWQLRRAWMFTFVGLTFVLCTVHVWSAVYSFVFFLFGSGTWMLSAEPAIAGAQQASEVSGSGKGGLAFRRLVSGADDAQDKRIRYTRFSRQ